MESFTNVQKITTDVTHVNENDLPDTILFGSLAYKEINAVNTTPSTEET